MKKSILGILIIVLTFVGYLVQEFNEDKKKEYIAQAEDSMLVHFIDVGEGDSTLIQLPDGKNMLIDAGDIDKGETVTEYIKNTGIEKIDFIIGTHPHSDHIGGLETVINNFETENIYMPKVLHDTVTFENLLSCIKRKGYKVKSPMAGDILYSEGDVKIEVLSPMEESYKNLNNYSMVVKIRHGEKVFLFTGDAENIILNRLSIDEKVDVLKIPHHGSETSGSEMFYMKVMPKFGVISVGDNNSYGHPHKEVMERIKRFNIECFRTDTDGTIVFESDGKNIKVLKGE